jgi:hypothetical protein
METFTIIRESAHDPDLFYVTHSGLGMGFDKNVCFNSFCLSIPSNIFLQSVGIADFMKLMNENVQDYLHNLPRFPSSQLDEEALRPPHNPALSLSPQESEGKASENELPLQNSLVTSDLDFVVIEDDAPPAKSSNKIEVRRYVEIDENQWNSFFDLSGLFLS